MRSGVLFRVSLVLALLSATGVAQAPTVLRGFALDPTGKPLPGARIVTKRQPDLLLAVASENGAFEITAPLSDAPILELSEEGPWATVLGCAVRLVPDGAEAVVVGAPAVQLQVRVLNARGQPAGAFLSLSADVSALSGFPLPLDGSCWPRSISRSEGDGHFTVRVADMEGLELQAWTEGQVTSAPVRQLIAERDPTIVVPDVVRDVVRGRVRRADGTPLSGAYVASALDETWSEADGSFALQLANGWGSRHRPLCAAAEDWSPATVPDLAARLEEPEAEPFLEFVLDEPALSIDGVILHTDGNPAAGWCVELRDGFAVAPGMTPPSFAEHVSGGRWNLVGPRPVRTDEQGRFRIRGLARRPYVLDAWSGRSSALRTEPIDAGTQGVVLRVPEDSTVDVFRGRVVDDAGGALGGIDVRFDLDIPHDLLDSGMLSRASVTDSAGGFELRGIARHHSWIGFSGAAVMKRRYPVSEPDAVSEPDDGETTFMVPRRSYLRFVHRGPHPLPDSIAALDERGEAQELVTSGASWSSSTTRFALTGSSTHALAVSCAAKELVAYREGVEVARLPLQLSPGRVFTATPE